MPASIHAHKSADQAAAKTVKAEDRTATIQSVRAKEKLHERVDALSAQEAEQLLAALEGGPEAAADPWGDLSAFHEVAVAESMQRLAQEEQAAGHAPW